MLVLLGDDETKAAAEAKTVLSLETELAKAQMDRISMRDPKNRDNPTTREEFVKSNPNFDFDAYFSALGAPQFSQMNDTTPKFFHEVNDLLGKTPIDDWKAYLRYRVLEDAAPALPAAFVKEDFNFNSAYLRGTKEMEPRNHLRLDRTFVTFSGAHLLDHTRKCVSCNIDHSKSPVQRLTPRMPERAS